MFDASSDALVDVAPIHFKKANGEFAYAGPGLPCRVHLFGPGTEQHAMVEARQTERTIKRMGDNDGKITLAPPEDRAKEQAQDLADLTSHFENFAYEGRELTRDRFKAFYLDRKMTHYHRQVAKSLGDVGNWRPGETVAAGNS